MKKVYKVMALLAVLVLVSGCELASPTRSDRYLDQKDK
jgi:predicted small lipoprotein YifL